MPAQAQENSQARCPCTTARWGGWAGSAPGSRQRPRERRVWALWGRRGGDGPAAALGGTPKAYWPFPGTRRGIIPGQSRPAVGAVPSRGPGASPVALCAAHRPGPLRAGGAIELRHVLGAFDSSSWSA